MAATVVPNLTLIDDAESLTPWTANGAALDPDFFVQNANSVSWNATKNGRRSAVVAPAASIAWSSYTYAHLYFWMATSVAAKSEPKRTGTSQASGLCVRVTLANGAYREWHVAGSDTWGGEWKCFCVDMAHTGAQLYASSGTWTSSSNITSVTIYLDLTNSGNIRNAINTWQDVLRVGEGLTAYSPDGVTAIDFADIAAQDEAVANRYGILETKDGVIFCQGRITLGDSAGANNLLFDSTDEVFVWKELDGSGYGLANAALYGIDVVGNGTAGTQTFDMGVKVGSGYTASGRNGTLFRTGGANVTWYADLADANITSCTIYGCTFQGANSTSPKGVGFTGSPATFELAGCTFDGCEQIDTRDAVTSRCNFLNTVAPSTSGALLWDEAEIDARNCLFANNAVGIEVPTLTANMTLYGMTYSGNTFDVRYEGASNYDASIPDGDTPTIQNAGAGTLTAVASRTLTITDLVNGSEVRIYQTGTTTEEAGTESVTGNQFQYTYAQPPGFNVDIVIHHVDYEHIRRVNYVLPATNTSIPIPQTPDDNYENP